MNPYETYLMYSALRLHFTSNYDYFKYKGVVRRSPESFRKLSENQLRMFQNVSNVFEPKLYLAGNFIFNSSNFIRDFDENSYLTYRKFLTNGEYIFSEDLKKMGPSLRADLDFSNGQIPNIIQKLMSNEVSLFTACALEAMLGWTHFGGDDSNILFDDIIKRVRKSHKFFKVNINTYKGIVVSHYKTLSTK